MEVSDQLVTAVKREKSLDSIENRTSISIPTVTYTNCYTDQLGKKYVSTATCEPIV
jgi:hypothetical protein